MKKTISLVISCLIASCIALAFNVGMSPLADSIEGAFISKAQVKKGDESTLRISSGRVPFVKQYAQKQSSEQFEVIFDFDINYASYFTTGDGVSSGSNGTYVADGEFNEDQTITIDDVTLFVKASSADAATRNRVWASSPRLRLYNEYFTVSAPGKKITKIVFTGSATNFNVTVDAGTLSGKEWIGDVSELTFTVSKNTQISTFIVTFENDLNNSESSGDSNNSESSGDSNNSEGSGDSNNSEGSGDSNNSEGSGDSEDSMEEIHENWLGKCWSYFQGNEKINSMGFSTKGTFDAGIIVTSRPGYKLTAISVPFFSGVNVSNVSVKVSSIDVLKDYYEDEKHIITSKQIDDVRTGYYNLVLLDNPVEFPDNGQLFVYYTFEITQILNDEDNYPFVFYYTDEPIYGSLFVSQNYYSTEYYWMDYSDLNRASALKVYILPNVSPVLWDYESLKETPLTTVYQTCTEYANLLREFDEKLGAGEEVDLDELENAYTNLEIKLQDLKSAMTSYNRLCDKLIETKEYYNLGIDRDFSEAYETLQRVISNISALTTDEIIAAERSFSEAYNILLAIFAEKKLITWDFNISAETIGGLHSDEINWSYNGNYYKSIYSSDYYELLCYRSNGTWCRIPETEGIYFNRGGYNWYIYTDGSNRIRSYGSGVNYAFDIPSLIKGQVITINYKTASSGSSRGIYRYSDNLQVVAGEELSTEYGEVAYLVTSDGDVAFYPYNGGIYINSISITTPNDCYSRLAESRKEAAEYMDILDEYPGLKRELEMAYNNAVIPDEESDIENVISNLKIILSNIKKAVEIYPTILADIDFATTALEEESFTELSEALALGTSIDVNTSISAEYFAAFEALETTLAIYNSSKVEMSDWAFNTSSVCTVDGLRYYLDTTNNLAEFINFNNSNVYSGALIIPTIIRYNGTTYAVVAMINNGRYTQSNITSVTLPKTLRFIGDYGLGNFSNVRSIEIPKNVTSMGSNVFNNSNNLTTIKVNAVIPPSIGSMSGSSYKKITIPEGCFHAYRIANVWKDNILIAGDGVIVSTGKIVAGDLGHVVLDEATYFQEVNKLIIDEGTMNNDDWNAIKSMTNLIEIDMTGVSMSSLPANAFDGRWAIENIKLPHNISSIGNYSLRGTGIKQITLPESITTLGTYAFSNCDSIRTISIPERISSISNYCFNDCDKLQNVELHEGLTAINQYAFSSCDMLTDVVFPSSLTSIGSYAFRYCPIKTIDLPSGITAINSYSFADNSVLDSLFIPETINTINSNAFYNCTSLKDVKFSEGLVNLYGSAFSGCKKLTEIVLPSSLEKCESAPFNGCSGIKKIESRSVIPAKTGGYCPISNVNLTEVILFVPYWSTSEYQLATGWNSFYTIEPSNYMPQNIKVNKDFYFTVREEFAADYRPNIFMIYSDVQSTDAYGYTNFERGNLTISGRSKLAVNWFEFVVSPFAKYYSDENVRYGYNYDYYSTQYNSTSLIVNGEMRAEDVCMHLDNYNSRWQFVTFPFDVKVSDIVPQNENISWVIRGHNSAMRAAGKVDSVWVNLTADDILEAGKGYIMHNYAPDYNNSWFWVYPLKNSVNRQLIFSSEDRTIELEENLAEFDHNRSWNLIGNPYPCFYDSRFMDFDAPFMVWNSYNQNYVAYNPADDAYILSPGEAFFVQRPFEQEFITFHKEGRQTHRYARELTLEAPMRANIASKNHRAIYNLTLQQDTLVDRTRVVFNDAASFAYEMSRDAAKFASTESNVPQIFTIADKTRYAINERPFVNGDVALGIYCGIEGKFTISIDKTYGCKVILEDKLLKTFVELSGDNNYTFSASAGENLTRFVLHFENGATGVNNVNIDNETSNDNSYNLQGIKVKNTDSKGIYIKNGQKTIIK